MAERLTLIEQERRHAELTPEFRFTYRAENRSSKTASLVIELVGPVGLDALDSVTLSFRGDGMARGVVDNVFGPVRFVRGVDGAPSRTMSTSKSIERGGFLILQVEQTQPHASGWNDQSWAAEFQHQPVRLRLECRKQGWPAWFLTQDLEGPNLADPGDGIL